ncbi:hypothetical protein C8F04DRAFT_164852 [Mycena alexandri]|uniref:F-box domain-containing protein n=1 Tax=Mycena alexandri TaxID=1745969 RepID=A0AAD6SAU8_9AGAR|nr:hypothetical protein C8F04DRAFT_164852 [Mycena alexandri]
MERAQNPASEPDVDLPNFDELVEPTTRTRTERIKKAEKKMKRRGLNPLLVTPLSALPLDICARFPTELHEYIIAQLRDDRQTLSICSLVSTHWSASSRYHLFQTASTIHVHRNNFQQFCELLATQRLNIYVGRLRLETHIIDDRFPGGATFQFNHDLHRFTGLPSLKYLCLEGHHDNLFPEFFAALAQNFQSVTELELISMHFDSFTQFQAVVDSLPLLRCLMVDGSLPSDFDSDSEDEGARTPPTYSRQQKLVDVVAICNRMPEVLSWLPFQSNIRRLAISIARWYRDAHTPLLSNVLRMLGPRLEHLILHDTDTSHPLDLSANTALHTLELIGIECLWATTQSDLEWVPALLSQLRSPILRRLALVVHLEDHRGVDLFDWPRIAESLAPFNSLAQVKISVSNHKNRAAEAIAKYLQPRSYALQVVPWERRYQYSLRSFDSVW